jgi:hypothetical protein
MRVRIPEMQVLRLGLRTARILWVAVLQRRTLCDKFIVV